MKFSASRSVAILGSAVDRAVRSRADKNIDIANESMIIQNARPLLKFGFVDAGGVAVADVSASAGDVVAVASGEDEEALTGADAPSADLEVLLCILSLLMPPS